MKDFWSGLGLSRLVVAGVSVVLACGMAGCKAVPHPTPLSELTKQEVRGRTVYQARCAMCHYDRKDEPLHGPTMSGVFKRPALPSGAAATNERVTAAIEHGHGLMPAIDGIDAEQMDDLLAYMHTL